MPLSVADLVDYLNTTAPADPSPQRTEMQRALDTATQEITRTTGLIDAAPTTVRVYAPPGASVLVLPYVRLASISTVTDPGGLVDVGAIIDLQAGLINLGAVSSGGTWSVVATGNPWPAALQTAALDWAAHLYDTQRTVAHPVDNDQPTPSYALPNRVEELLRPYRMAGIA